ncbi:hypothetical protein [Sphingomonas suaedae]|uniref:hypothetical protein n=1 Tax=Sphingomonas suaedae TaxID=2599297 RepID=UPI001648ADA3|nr:hypothetical protein [Sphingomonas suaedae]
MRESGFVGLIQVVFRCAQAGFGSTRAWAVVATMLLLVALPVALVAGLIWLLV